MIVFFKSSIRGKLLITMLLLIISLLVSLTVIQTTSQKHILENAWQEQAHLLKQILIERGKTLSDQLALEMEEALASFNLLYMINHLNQVARDIEDLSYIILTDHVGRTHVHTLNPRLQGKILLEAEDLFANQQEQATINEYQKGDQGYMEFIVPIYLSTDLWGRLRLGYSVLRHNQNIAATQQLFQQQIQNLLIRSIMIACIFLLISSCVIWVVMTTFVKPLLYLKQSAEKVESGKLADLNTIVIDSTDEVGSLAQSFNKMIVSLQEHDRLVEKHTQQLLAVNTELINEIEQRKRTEQLVEKYKYVLESTTELISFVDKNYVYEAVNEAYLKAHGKSREDIEGSSIAELNGKETFEEVIKPVFDKCLQGEKITYQSWFDFTNAGHQFVEVNYHPIYEQNEIIGVLVNVRNMTERKLAEDKIIRLNEELEQRVSTRTNELQQSLTALHQTQSQLVHSEKMASLGTLVAGVAHEINNPTNFVHNGAQNINRQLNQLKELIFQLAEAGQKEAVKQLFGPKFTQIFQNLNAILDGSQRISTIVSDLTTFGRRDKSEAISSDISKGLESTIKLVRTQYREKIEFTHEVQPLPPTKCWPSQLNQVFMNLIINSCQAIQNRQQQSNENIPGKLIVSALAEDEQIIIRVQDNGCGISKETQNKIFEPFFTTKTVGKGTGLGLSIVFGIIEKHKGNISLESIEGEGSTFTITLPIIPS
ncbi:MAG: PAS domain S-box protein [SAR324 cluster bacterium]|nr:PAS domain S-box protein [SAR324 cluster bacterium]